MARFTVLLAMLLDAAAAHTIMNQIIANGQTYPQGTGIYMPSSNVYQDDVNANTMACNGAPATGFASSKTVIPVKAGDTVTGAWLHELTSTGPGNDADNKVLASSHKGPVIAYMKKVADASANPASGPGNGWFKVAEAGLISPNQWAVDKLIADGGLQQVKIPACLESGDYLMRFEIIALHSAGNAKGAQFYMECAQFRVTGATSPQSPATYSIPGIYSATDPGILVSIYGSTGQPYPASYKIPGPAVFQCSANGGSSPAPAPSSSAKPVTSAAPTKATTVAPAPTTKVTTAAPAPTTFVTSVAKPVTSSTPPATGSGTVAKYGQCGGQGYSGSKTCAAGSTCKFSNDWYSQCL